MRLLRTILMLSIALPLGLVACGSAPVSRDKRDVSETPVWPLPPDEPRVRYVRSVAGPEDWGIHKSVLRRLIDFLTNKADERFVRPTGLGVRDGVLYVADPGAHALWILDAARDRMVRVAEIGDQALGSPVAVAPGPDGGVFLADSVLGKVFLLSDRGRPTGVVLQEGLEQPVGLAFDAATRRLYVADSAAHHVAVFDERGRRIATIGTPGSEDGEFNRPTHVALDRAGMLLVTDALNFRIQAFDLDGRFAWKFGRHGDSSGDLATPKGIASDSEGHVVVADALFDAVQIFDRGGDYLLAFGGRGERPGQFWLPNGLAIDAADRIYVADAYNRRIQIFATGAAARKESDQ
jgi:DNA-binding beta-propeller fold protein YncE